jgi:two-component system phosphate regulon sensor histidine kinase PhoR
MSDRQKEGAGREHKERAMQIGRNRGDVPAAVLLPALAAALLVAFLLLTFAAGLGAAKAAGCLAPVAVLALLALRRHERPLRPRARAERGSLWPDQGLKALAGALGSAAVLTDGRGVVRYRNAEARALAAHLTPGEPLALGLRVPVILEALDRVMAGAPALNVAWSQRVPTEQWFEARVAPIAYPPRPADAGAAGRDARPDFILVTVEDLTERHRLERMRADFVANASHELRTPLAAVSGFIETLQGPARDDPAARERFLAIMSDQARRMRRLIDDLLSLSRIEMRAHLRPADTVDLAEILPRVVSALAPIAGDVSLDLDVAGPPLPLRGDADELAQVFSNLIENAIKYGGAGKTVTVRAGRAAAGAIVVSVADQGPGIAAEHLPRLTERFYRADIASSRAKQGTGLGLAIVKHILARHRARLSIASPPGEGATFTVTFPVEEQEAHDRQGVAVS